MADYTVKETRSYAQPNDKTYQAALKAIAGLEGKVLSQDQAAGTIKGQFSKTIHGKVLGDRSEMLINVASNSDGQSSVTIEAYPINPVGQKLLFGARKGVVPTVVGWFWAHVEHNL